MRALMLLPESHCGHSGDRDIEGYLRVKESSLERKGEFWPRASNCEIVVRKSARKMWSGEEVLV